MSNLKFANGTKEQSFNGHEELRKELIVLATALNTIKGIINSEIRTVFEDETMSGNYARALKSECDELMKDIENLDTVLKSAETEISKKIDTINAGTVYKSIVPADYVGKGRVCIENQIVIGLKQSRENQTIDTDNIIISKQVKTTQKPPFNETTVTKNYPAVKVVVSGYEAQNFIVADIDGNIVTFK